MNEPFSASVRDILSLNVSFPIPFDRSFSILQLVKALPFYIPREEPSRIVHYRECPDFREPSITRNSRKLEPILDSRGKNSLNCYSP